MTLQESLEELEREAKDLADAAKGTEDVVKDLVTSGQQAIDGATQWARDLVVSSDALTTFVLGPGFEGEIGAFSAAIGAVRSKAESLPECLEALQIRGATLLESFASDSEAFADLIEERREAFEELLETQHELVDDEFEELVGSVEERAKAVFDSIGEFIQDVLVEKPTDAMEATTDVLANGLEDANELVGDVASGAIDGATERITNLADHVTESAAAAVQGAAEKLIELLVQRIASEAADAVLETQVGAQFTMAMQQYLPALIAANAVAGQVQQLLNAARMGT